MVDWQGDTPFSSEFNDIYFQSDGLAEARHVFLAGNDLPQRWNNTNPFVIAEAGFGTGLNFLAVWDLLTHHPSPPLLHYYGIELYPLRPEDIKKAHRPFAEIASLSEKMLQSYPSNFSEDWHYQPNKNLRLTVFAGDARKRLRDIPPSVDAWFLDGFAPAQNPELWSADIFHGMAQKAGTGTSFATFTVARTVRDHAHAAGFTLQKRKGFGKKRDMLTGYYHG